MAVVHMQMLCHGSELYFSVSCCIALYCIVLGLLLHCIGVHFSSINVFDSPMVAIVPGV
jgi:hypothetical protein